MPAPTGLSIPSFGNPNNTNAPYVDAYGWIAGVVIDASRAIGRITVNVHPDAEAWLDGPVDQVGMSFGEVLSPADPKANPPVEEVRFLSFAEFRAIAAEAGGLAWDAQVAVLLDAVRRHPLLRDAVLI